MCQTSQSNTSICPEELYRGLPKLPYYQYLGWVLCRWGNATDPTDPPPFATILTHSLSGVQMEMNTNLQMLMNTSSAQIRLFFSQLAKLIPGTAEANEAVNMFLASIGGTRGVLTLLGVRTTVGSCDNCPPTRVQCLEAFNVKHSNLASQELTVGARALTKHCDRSSDGWWGQLKGNDKLKNEAALTKIEYILDNTVWLNIHVLPHDQVVFEIREHMGYGARWGVQEKCIDFRGFLEPQMIDGHEMRWKH